MRARYLSVSKTEFAITFTIRHRKRLDLTISEEVKSAILRKVSMKYYRVILDLQAVEFIDTAAINMLLELSAYFKNTGHDFSIINLSGPIMELIRLSPPLLELVTAHQGIDN